MIRQKHFLPDIVLWHDFSLQIPKGIIFYSENFNDKGSERKSPETALNDLQSRVDTLKEKQETLLNDLVNPQSMIIREDKLYIVDGLKIKIYSLKDYKLVTTIGGEEEGDGPGEWKIAPGSPIQLQLSDNGINVFAIASKKIVSFSLEGDKYKYEKETKTIPQPYIQIIEIAKITEPESKETTATMYIGQKFLYQKEKNGHVDKIAQIALLKEENNELTEVAEQKLPFLPAFPYLLNDAKFPLPQPFPIIQEYEKTALVLIETEKGFCISRYDFNCNTKTKEFIITTPIDQIYKKLNKDNTELVKMLEENPDYKNQPDMYKKRMVISDTIPAIQYMVRDGDMLYLQTYRRDKETGHCEFLVFDLKAPDVNASKKVIFLPAATKDPFSLTTSPSTYTFSNGIYYYLVINEDTSKWELHTRKIDLEK